MSDNEITTNEGRDKITGRFTKGNQEARKNKGLRHKINREIQEAIAKGIDKGNGIGEVLRGILVSTETNLDQKIKVADMLLKAQLNPNLYIDLEGDELVSSATEIQDSILELIGKKRALLNPVKEEESDPDA